MSMPSRKELFIGGSWTSSDSRETIQVVSPRTEEVSGEAPEAAAADVDAAVAAARQAFDGPWRQIPFEARVQVLEKARDGLGRRADQIAEAMEAEQGLPAAAARAGMIPAVMRMMDVAIDCARQIALLEVRRDAQGAVLVEQVPKGVVSAIVPFNGPLPIAVLKCAPALLAGCPVVLKASELTPLSVFYLAEAFEEAGLPDGMLNVISGSGRTGQRMVEHPDVDMISFTGSTAVGRRIAEVAAAGLKNLSLELGGKSAAIVLEDADMAVVGQVVAGGTFASAGQYCRALTRTLAPRSRYDEVVDSLATVAGAMIPGDRMGPLISAKQRDRVESYVAAARDEGARLVTGGKRPEEPAKGFYYEATVFADATNEMRFVREEIFGPVIAVIPYDTVEEAVAIANDTEYGLSGAVFSVDARAGLEVARRVRTGTTGVNLHGARSCAPCGGMKSSGIGQEHGPEGFLEFLTPKAILIPEDLAQDLEREGIASRPAIR
jgi:aldehyde dehydrogenase (NAD+)